MKSDMELNRLQALITGGVTVSDAAVREAYQVRGHEGEVRLRGDLGGRSEEDDQPERCGAAGVLQAERSAVCDGDSGDAEDRVCGVRRVEPAGRQAAVIDAEVQAYYNAHQDQYQVKEQVKTRHILIAVPAGADAKTDAAAKAKAEDVLKQIKAGGNFADLAKKYSDDPGSKTQGGELGWLDRGKTVPEYAKAAMALTPGQTSDLVKSQFGYHIIQTEEKKTAHVRPLAEVKD